MLKRYTLLFLVFGAAFITLPTSAIDPSLSGKIPAPEFPDNLEWLNTDKPVKLADLKGKVVLLDFWTYCCINCIHEIPDLKKLEAKYPNELVVIGVHSAKFTTEQGTDNIREAILRYEIEHPVVNDKDFVVWKKFGARGWPTFVLIDPEGKMMARRSGEGLYESWEPAIAKIIQGWDGEKKIDRRPVKWSLEKAKAPKSVLSFPGKLAADAQGQRLFISDSNHNRIVIVGLPDGAVQEVIGSGAPGLKDGSFTDAQFKQPQGLAVDPSGNTLYVADTENHALREINLKDKTVKTLAGTGEQARRHNEPGVGKDVLLNSPWDLLVHNGKLYIAMAGPHQLWTFDLATHEARPYAGTGREDIIDGPLDGAALAQPSGITTDGKQLFFADSEVSAVRAADLDPKNGEVKTLMGKGLFDFGDIDGNFDAARLQHCIGVLHHQGALYVADTYNNKIKRIDLAKKSIQFIAGTGQPGMKDGPAKEAQLNEPNGLAFASGKLYIADTNNHAIRILDLSSNQLTTLKLTGVEKLVRPTKSSKWTGDIVQAPAQTIAPGAGTIDISLTLPKGYKLNAEAPTYVAITAADPKVIGVTSDPAKAPTFPLKLPATFTTGQTTVQIDLVIYYCESAIENICLVKQVRIETPVQVAIGAAQKSLTATLDLSSRSSGKP